MFPTSYCIKKAWLLFPLMLLSVLLHAQQGEPDSLPPVMQEDLPDSATTIIEELKQDGTTDETTSTGSIYFLQKTLQPNGGGPDSVRWKNLPDTVVNRLKADDNFWYVNYVFNKAKKDIKETQYDKEIKQSKKPAKGNSSFILSSFFQTLLWVLIIGGFAAFVIVYLANSNTALFRKKNTIIHSDEEMEVPTDNIFEINYQREIDKAVINGNYRFAVRLMFLRVLKNLSDKKAIQYTPDRTNFDYLLQLQSTGHYTDFFKLTRNYEYSWYGHFDIDMDKFLWLRRDFESFDQKLK